MKKNFLSTICFIYVIIIVYVKGTNSLKNYLAPNMHLYLLISAFLLLLIGIILIFNKDGHYKFKISDLILFLPLIMLFISNDGKLTTSFASNRTSKVNSDIVKKKKIKEQKQEDNFYEKTDTENNAVNYNDYDFSTVDFDIKDDVYNSLTDYFTYSEKAKNYSGKTVRIKGFAVKKDSSLPKGYFLLGKYTISCCAADSYFIGLMAKYDLSKIKNNSWYEIEGLLEKGTNKYGTSTMFVNVVNIKSIKSSDEEQYVYPCYNYGDGNCSEVTKYNLEY